MSKERVCHTFSIYAENFMPPIFCTLNSFESCVDQHLLQIETSQMNVGRCIKSMGKIKKSFGVSLILFKFSNKTVVGSLIG